MNQVAVQDRDVLTVIRDRLQKLDPELKTALPKHIPVERFRRVAITAIQRNPELALADQKSLFGACMTAAQDGLLPDGREAALVVFKTKIKRDGQEQYIQQVQYLPMVAGIRKRIYQSGEIRGLTARAAYQNDEFDYAYGLNEFLEHKPCRLNRGPLIAAYAIVTYKDGSKEFDVMEIPDIEKVRYASRRPDSGPWKDWYDEMAKKSVIRRLGKGLPLSTDLQDLLHRDDSFYDLETRQPVQQIRPAPQTIEARLKTFAADSQTTIRGDAQVSPDDEGSVPIEDTRASSSASAPACVTVNNQAGVEDQSDAYQRGYAAQQSDHPRQIPAIYKDRGQQDNAEEFLKGWDDAARESAAESAARDERSA